MGKTGPGLSIIIRLSLMMTLEFFVFGAWYATLGLVLATVHQAAIIGAAYTLGAIAAIASPLLMGAIGDRFFDAKIVFGVSHLIGGAIMLGLPYIVNTGDANLILAAIFIYMLVFVPTIGIANSIAFRNLGEGQGAFPYIRGLGTVGWVIAGLCVGALHYSATTGVFTVAGLASLGLGAFSFLLPNTPPSQKGARFSLGDVVGAKAFVLFKKPNFTVLILCAFLTSISIGIYNSYTSPYLGALGTENVAGLMALGQLSEVVFIFAVPLVLKRFGMKASLLLGMAMWGVRFGLYILAGRGHPEIMLVAILLHGICSDFFIVLAAMYIDQVAGVEIKAQAQNWLILVISGFGTAVGSYASGIVYARTVGDAASNPSAWEFVWLVPIGAAVLTSLIWALFFRNPPRAPAAISPVNH